MGTLGKLRQAARRWPVVRQLRTGDPTGRGEAARSDATGDGSAINTADRVVQSVCPFCAVGCGQRVFVRDGEITQIEGDPESPVSRGRLCPKGAATRQLVTSPSREYRVKYRRPHGTEWEHLPLEQAMDRIADRIIDSRRRHWQDTDEQYQDQGEPHQDRTLQHPAACSSC